MPQAHDITRSLVTGKVGEGMIAFTGLRLLGADGVLKVAAFRRPDDSGYLTLTCLIDLESRSTGRKDLEQRFDHVSQPRLQAWLGDDFQVLVSVPLDGFAPSGNFFIQEFNLYFRSLAGRERFLLQERVLPALEHLLGCVFDELDWVEDIQPAQGAYENAPEQDSSAPMSLKQHLRRWLTRAGKS